MNKPPYDQRLARLMVRPLAQTPITPNQITALTLLLAVGGAFLFAQGDGRAANWGAGLFVVARFLDHFDGELTRLKDAKSRLGYYFDYIAGALSYIALFAGIGVGLAGGALGGWALALGAMGATAAILSLFINLDIDKQMELTDGNATGYPGVAGFELEDGIYLIAPVTWLGWLTPFFVLCGIGAATYCLWSAWSLVKLRAARND